MAALTHRPLTVRLVILNYNGQEMLPKCLPSLVEAVRHTSYPTKITLLDNRSTDGGPEWVKREFPDVEVVFSPQNRFLVSYNDYLKEMNEDIAILLNNDIRVDRDFMDPLIQTFGKFPDAFLATPQVLSFDGTRYEGGRTRAKLHWGIFWSSAIFPGYEVIQSDPGFTFAAGFGAFHRKRFLALGGYDDLYLPGIMEDGDLGFRAWREGYRSYYVPQSHVYHWGQMSFKKAFGEKGILTLAHRNGFFFIWKNLSDPTLLLEHGLLLLPRLLWALARGQAEFVVGFFQALQRFPEAWRKRRFPPKRAYRDRELFELANGFPLRRRYRFRKRWKRILVRIFDFLGETLMKQTGKSTERPIRKILVVRADSLGDAVLSLPAIQSLSKRFPQSQIDFLVSPAVEGLYARCFPSSRQWVLNELSLRQVFSLSKAVHKSRYDLAVDGRGDLRTIFLAWLAGIPERWGHDGTGGGFLLTRARHPQTQQHELLQQLALVTENGGPPPIEFPRPALEAEAEKKVEQWLKGIGDLRKILIHPGAGYPSKRWGARKFADLARRIHEEKFGIPIFIGSREERTQLDAHRQKTDPEWLNFMGQTSFPELMCLLGRADLFVGNDSGPAHLAAWMQRKLVILFSGTNDYRQWAPWSDRLRIVSHPVPCSPCEERICPLRRQWCLEEISVEEVFGAVKEMLHD